MKPMRQFVLSLTLAAVGALGVASFAPAATAPAPTGFFEGNITSCSTGAMSAEAVLDLDGPWAGGSSGSWPVTQVSADGLTVDITGVTTVDGQLVFDWASNLPVDLAVVKQGSGGAYWLFNPAQTSGTLAAYRDGAPSGGVSHVVFCYSPKLAVTKTAVTKMKKTYTWEIAKKEKDGKTELNGEIGASAGTANYEIALTKTLASTQYTVEGVITVKNNSTTDLLAVTVADMLPGATNLVVEASCTGAFALAAGGTKTCAYSADVPDGSARTNTASADSGSDLVGDGTGTAAVVFDGSTPVTTVGNSIDVSDDFATPAAAGDDKHWAGIDSTTTVSYAHEFTCGGEAGSTSYENTASIDGTDKSSSWTIEVTCAEKAKLDLVVAKTADGDWFRNNVWSVTKTHSPGGLTLSNGSSGNVNWLIDVSKTAEVYGIVSGTITIENPNDFEVTGVTIDESLADAEISCELRGDEEAQELAVDAPMTIPGGGILDCEYDVLVDEPVSGSYTNEVDVTTADEEISGHAEDGYSFADEPSVDLNASITVTDAVLGQTWTASNGTDGDRTLPQTFTCSTDAGSHSNTVVLTGDNPGTKAVETDYVLGSATDSVTVTCNEAPLTPVTSPTVVPPVVTPPVASPTAPLLPPTAKPKPKAKPTPKPAVCTVITINRKSVAAGKKSNVQVKLTAGGKPVAGTKVRFAGVGINKVGKTNKSGLVIMSMTPRQSGIVTITVVGKQGCSTQRLGVVGTFEPPVTG